MGIMNVSPVPFTGSKLHLLPVGLPASVVPGATRVFDARVPLGSIGDPVTSWPDAQGSGTALTVGASLMTAATAPTLATDGGMQYVRFTKASKQALGQVIPRSNPHTVVTVARWRAAATTLEAVTSAGGGNLLQANASGASFRAYSGTSLGVVATIGTVWHVFITVFNGTQSINRLDNLPEMTGDVGGGMAPQLTLGGWNGTDFSGVDVFKVAYYPRALDATERATRVTELKAEFGI